MALPQLGGEQITVDGTAGGTGITSTLLVDVNGNTLGVTIANFQHLSGGKINTDAKATVTGGGAEGSSERNVGDEWSVTGYDDLVGFRMIKQTGEADAVVNCQLYGYP